MRDNRSAALLGEDAVAWVESVLEAPIARLQSIPSGMGRRRFVRVIAPKSRIPHSVARIDAPEDPRNRPAGSNPEPALEPLRSHWEASGIPVPQSFGSNPSLHIDLLEDVGPLSLEEAAQKASAADRDRWYEAALAIIVGIQNIRDTAEGLPAFTRRLDGPLLRYKGELFAAISLPRLLGKPPSTAEIECVYDAFECVADCVRSAPMRLAHRDFQSQNLYVDTSSDSPRLRVIDIQGALLAPPEYDAVCLMQDSYVALPDAMGSAWLDRLRPALPDAPSPETFRGRFDLLALARKAKDHARLLEASARDSRFARYIEHTERLLRGAAERCAARNPRLERFAQLLGPRT